MLVTFPYKTYKPHAHSHASLYNKELEVQVKPELFHCRAYLENKKRNEQVIKVWLPCCPYILFIVFIYEDALTFRVVTLVQKD